MASIQSGENGAPVAKTHRASANNGLDPGSRARVQQNEQNCRSIVTMPSGVARVEPNIKFQRRQEAVRKLFGPQQRMSEL